MYKMNEIVNTFLSKIDKLMPEIHEFQIHLHVVLMNHL